MGGEQGLCQPSRALGAGVNYVPEEGEMRGAICSDESKAAARLESVGGGNYV